MTKKQTIATDSSLNEFEQEILTLVLDQIIPADDSRKKPSASEVDVLAYILQHDHNYLTRLQQELELIQSESIERHKNSFINLESATQTTLVQSLRKENPRFLHGLAMNTAASYYQDDRVLNALGLEARPPFPNGYEVDRGDLSLLDPVKVRGKIYRDAPD